MVYAYSVFCVEKGGFMPAHCYNVNNNSYESFRYFSYEKARKFSQNNSNNKKQERREIITLFFIICTPLKNSLFQNLNVAK